MASLRSQGIRLIIYLDDILVLSQSVEKLQGHLTTVITLLKSLGLTINMDKSVLTPAQRMEFLGLVVDSISLKLVFN